MIVLVTGASRGLGATLLDAFSRDGAIGVAASRPGVDVTDHRSLSEFIDCVIHKHGRIDVLVNNAAILGPVGPLEDNAIDAWRATISVNLIGAVAAMQAVLPGMKERRFGRIINIAGGGATDALPRRSAYAASKAALVRLTECVAAEVSDLGVTVNAVLPGPLPTDMTREIVASGPERLGADEYAEHRGRQLDDGALTRAARLCVYLAGSTLNGRTISARFDPWPFADEAAVMQTDLYTLRRRDGD